MWEFRGFWRRHKRKVYVTLGVFGSGYLLYKLYDARRRRLHDLEKQLADERESDELIKAQIQAHFESVQRIADSTTLPHVMHFLSSRLAESLDLTHLTERLIQGKGQPNTLTTAEKLELWDRLKILSFTKMVSSLWAMTMLSLYVRVQVNILGRHLYIDTARGLGSSHLLDEAELIDKNDEQQFLACADYLSHYGLLALISDTETVTSEALKGKQLKDVFNVLVLHDTIIHILENLMIMGSPHHWLRYLMPEDAGAYKFAAPSSSSGSDPSHATKFELLMGETRAVLSSAEFANIVDVSLRAVVNVALEDLSIHCGENNLTSGMPLARLLPRISHMDQLLLTQPNTSRYIQIIQTIPEVEVFFTLLYSSMLGS
ncbi:Peroxisomal assembly protein PEX3 [Handroanthus impetiginosus]|uniref:Peroxisomal assembly protein PEX3 n=1 Tax=Handroanthus impetiginosus TaxID=429701 RepID=A0A2G9HYC9_9LAMI|nr:Peroxisomal assembly protein PEX3 [Handroanthus impetiginosus]